MTSDTYGNTELKALGLEPRRLTQTESRYKGHENPNALCCLMAAGEPNILIKLWQKRNHSKKYIFKIIPVDFTGNPVRRGVTLPESSDAA